MPLSPKEWAQIKEEMAKHKSFTVKQLLSLLEKKFLTNDPNLDTFSKAPENRSHIHVIKSNPVKEGESALEKKERERSFKIRTQSDSTIADEAAKKFKPPHK